MTAIEKLAGVARGAANRIEAEDFEEYEPGMFNTVNVPQSPKIVEAAKAAASEAGLRVTDRSASKSYVKIAAGKDSWIRLNLYECDEPGYGRRGDLNSVDVTEDVYGELFRR